MVTNKFISNTIAQKLINSQTLKDTIFNLTSKRLLVIEGMNLSEYKSFTNGAEYKNIGCIITIDPIGRDDQQSNYDFNVVLQVLVILSDEIMPNQNTIIKEDNHIVYTGFFSLEEVILKIICELKKLDFGEADLSKTDYEALPLEYTSNETFYKGFISLLFNEDICWNGDCE